MTDAPEMVAVRRRRRIFAYGLALAVVIGTAGLALRALLAEPPPFREKTEGRDGVPAWLAAVTRDAVGNTLAFDDYRDSLFVALASDSMHGSLGVSSRFRGEVELSCGPTFRGLRVSIESLRRTLFVGLPNGEIRQYALPAGVAGKVFAAARDVTCADSWRLLLVLVEDDDPELCRVLRALADDLPPTSQGASGEAGYPEESRTPGV